MDNKVQRNNRGVRKRMCKNGDMWALEHRAELGHEFLMTDIDSFIGKMIFFQNTENSLFIEYEPDDFNRHEELIREFAYIALFDRKNSRKYALSSHNRVSLAVHLNLCRRLGLGQPFPVKFFFVIGEQSPPYTMIEIDTKTGVLLSEYYLKKGHWREVWNAVGLVRTRDDSRQWLQNIGN